MGRKVSLEFYEEEIDGVWWFVVTYDGKVVLLTRDRIHWLRARIYLLRMLDPLGYKTGITFARREQHQPRSQRNSPRRREAED